MIFLPNRVSKSSAQRNATRRLPLLASVSAHPHPPPFRRAAIASSHPLMLSDGKGTRDDSAAHAGRRHGDGDDMTAEQNKLLIQRLVQEAVNQGNLDVLAEVADGEFAQVARQ